MIYFMVGPAENLTEDHIFNLGEPDVTKAMEYYRQRIIDVMDGEDILPGRFLMDSETGRTWRINVKLELEVVVSERVTLDAPPAEPFGATAPWDSMSDDEEELG